MGWCEKGFAVARLYPNGVFDSAFGPTGTVVSGGDAPLYAARLQPDGKLFVAGGSGAEGFSSARYSFDLSDAPILETEGTSGQAVALDSVTFTRGPFSITTDLNFSTDHRTRILLFTANLELGAGEDASAITVEARTAAGTIHQLPVEYFGGVPDSDWFKQIIVRLPDELAGAGEVKVRIIHDNTSSNHGSIVVN